MFNFNFSKKAKKQNDLPEQSEREARLLAETIHLKAELANLTSEKKELLSKLKVRELIDIKLGDPAPLDKEQRALYVAKVAGLHKEIFEPKIKHMISNAHSLLEETDNPRDYDLMVKGGIYMLWELHRWGELMMSEQVANQNNQNPSLPDEEINNPKQ